MKKIQIDLKNLTIKNEDEVKKVGKQGFIKNDRYKIAESLGAGSFVVVLKVLDTRANNEEYIFDNYILKNPFLIMFLTYRKAIKQIFISKYEKEIILNKIVPEINFLFSFKHENIVRYYEHFAIDDCLYLVLEFCNVWFF